jgi:outer membrane lipoprotein-sorting protein
MMRVDANARRAARWLAACVAVAVLATDAFGAVVDKGKAPPSKLTAEQIAEKNVAARGGLDAWRKIQSMVWVGHMESSDPNVPRLTFALQQKRPNKTRFELNSLAEKTLRLYDGNHGWKIKPKHDGSLDTQPYTPQDLQFARNAQGIDGVLIDYQAKGSAVELKGVEKVEGHKAYRLGVKLASGDEHDVWVDAKTFLDVKYDRVSYSPTGTRERVSVLYRNYQTVDGLQIPGTLEIGGGSNPAVARMVIDKIALNPPLDDKVFSKPFDRHRSRMATVEMEPNVDPRNAFAPPRTQGSGAPVTAPDPTPPLP